MSSVLPSVENHFHNFFVAALFEAVNQNELDLRGEAAKAELASILTQKTFTMMMYYLQSIILLFL